MRNISIVLAFTAGFSGIAAAQNRSAYETGMRIAAQRGYTGAKATCLANVFQSYASLQPFGRANRVSYAVEGPKVRALRHELYQRCGISI
jgi:hypothetical protein